MLGVSEMEQERQIRPLEPVLSERWVLSWWQAVVALTLSLSFLLYSYIPLNPTQLWTHVDRGMWSIEHGRLPDFDPTQPLAEGMPWINNNWIAEWALAGTYRIGGAEGLSILFAGLATAVGICWFVAFRRLTGRAAAAFVGWFVWTVCSFADVTRFGPLLFGALWMSLLINLVISRPLRHGGERDTRWWAYPIMGILFVAWANTHISVFAGLVVCLVLSAGQAIDRLRRTKSISAVMSDRRVRQWLVLTEVAAVCTLVNPHGIGLWRHALSLPHVSDAANSLDPLVAGSMAGAVFATTLVAILAAARHSRSVIRGREVLLILTFGTLAALHRPLMIWYVPIVVLVLLPRFSRMVPRFDLAMTKINRPLRPTDFRYSLVTALGIWTVFALSPASHPILGGTPRSTVQIYGKASPVAISDFLKNTSSLDLVWSPIWWSGWLKMHAGTRPFATHQLDSLPQLTQRDYWRIARAEEGWSGTLDRYGVDALVIDRGQHAELAAAARDLGGWHVAFEDAQGVVVFRNKATQAGGGSDAKRS